MRSGGFDLWDLASLSSQFVKSHAVKYFYGCVYDALGRWVYVSDSVGGFRLLPITGHEPPPVPGSPYERHVTSFDLSAEGRRLVMTRGGAGSNRVECWEVLAEGSFGAGWSIRDGELVDPGEPYYLNQANWFTNAVAISRDGQSIVTAESRQTTSGPAATIVLRHGATGKSIAELGTTDASFQVRLRFAPDTQAFYAWENTVVGAVGPPNWQTNTSLACPGKSVFPGFSSPSGRAVLGHGLRGRAGPLLEVTRPLPNSNDEMGNREAALGEFQSRRSAGRRRRGQGTCHPLGCRAVMTAVTRHRTPVPNLGKSRAYVPPHYAGITTPHDCRGFTDIHGG